MNIGSPFLLQLALTGRILWPLVLVIVVVLTVLGFVLPVRWARVVCLALAVALVLDCLAGGWWLAGCVC